MKGWLPIILGALTIWTSIAVSFYIGLNGGRLEGYSNGLLEGWDLAVTQCRADIKNCATVDEKGWRQ